MMKNMTNTSARWTKSQTEFGNPCWTCRELKSHVIQAELDGKLVFRVCGTKHELRGQFQDLVTAQLWAADWYRLEQVAQEMYQAGAVEIPQDFKTQVGNLRKHDPELSLEHAIDRTRAMLLQMPGSPEID